MDESLLSPFVGLGFKPESGCALRAILYGLCWGVKQTLGKVFFNFLTRLDSIFVRHVNVKNNQAVITDAMGFDMVNSLLSIDSLLNTIELFAELCVQHIQEKRGVVRD